MSYTADTGISLTERRRPSQLNLTQQRPYSPGPISPLSPTRAAHLLYPASGNGSRRDSFNSMRSLSPPAPPSIRRPATPPAMPTAAELAAFKEHCVAFLYKSDDNARLAMEQTLNAAPQLHRKQYTSLQSQVRAAYHADVEAKKREALEIVLRNCHEGQAIQESLGVGKAIGTSVWRCSRARKERKARLCQFLSDHALKYVGGDAR